jgi:hypothetical protein
VQERSRGLYKGMSGRPAYSSNDFQGDNSDHAISVEFFLSRPPPGAAMEAAMDDADSAGKVVPLNLHIMVAAGLVLIYHFLLPSLYATR